MTIPNIYDAGFVKKMAIFSKKNSTTDILQGHKYASVDMLRSVINWCCSTVVAVKSIITTVFPGKTPWRKQCSWGKLRETSAMVFFPARIFWNIFQDNLLVDQIFWPAALYKWYWFFLSNYLQMFCVRIVKAYLISIFELLATWVKINVPNLSTWSGTVVMAFNYTITKLYCFHVNTISSDQLNPGGQGPLCNMQ